MPCYTWLQLLGALELIYESLSGTSQVERVAERSSVCRWAGKTEGVAQCHSQPQQGLRQQSLPILAQTSLLISQLLAVQELHGRCLPPPLILR